MEDIKEVFNHTTPKKIIGITLIELGCQRQSMYHTMNNAWSISSDDQLYQAIQKNKDESDYLLSLL